MPCTGYHLNNEQVKVHYSDVSTIQIPTVRSPLYISSPLHVPTYHLALHHFRPSFNRPNILTFKDRNWCLKFKKCFIKSTPGVRSESVLQKGIKKLVFWPSCPTTMLWHDVTLHAVRILTAHKWPKFTVLHTFRKYENIFYCFFAKNFERSYFDQDLECAAPKQWSKYSTGVVVQGKS